MAIDQTPPIASPESMTPPAIENEFPTYRAISSMAIFSLILGLASVFCFANPWFLILVACSSITGWLALRRIARLPEILTGASYARVGIGIGLLFAISSLTHEVLQEYMTTSDARRFANYYIEVLRDKPLSQAMWYLESLEYRKEKSPDQIAEALKNSKNPTTTDPFGTKAEPFLKIKERLKSPGQVLSYSKIETKLVVGLTIYANALLEVDGPVTPEYPKKEYALIKLTKNPGVGNYDWVVQEFVYPYTVASAKVEAPHDAGDGHGH